MLKVSIIATSLFAMSVSAYTLPENKIDSGKVYAQEKPITLLGQGVTEGQQAPDFKVVNDAFVPVKLSDFQGKAIVISVVPSLDTGICSLQTKHFNEQVAKTFSNIEMLTISADLPFAQKRFCKQENIDKVVTLSDSVWRNFGENYGLYIKDMGLLSRAVFILDKDHKIVYKQLVKNLATEPDYSQVVHKLKTL
ncbi:lipid hydroperoxide peroxidase [Pseudoalteromonas sp. MSK9-3]|uniref:thiol peroxidase n=1 Tax=Pseudoalteromonas sp. MSK9-3 TaxID=1897633 RepID=UPI000E6C20E0|nr:thiol peroxidase [Pseudoalteromonas sp. MSK9-3]RJE75840.1 lipid hydroperoxide peroxidase [Pseudoalteromonas sp. MSK9-3]